MRNISRLITGKTSLSYAGAVLFLIFVLIALLAELIAPYSPTERFESYSPPNREHLLGTNDLGNDILSELIYGTRISLLVGFGAAFLANGIGLILGLFSGYFRGLTDEIIMGLTDIFLMIPRIPLIIILAAFLSPSFWLVGLVIGLLWWTSTARVVRSKTLQVREMNYIQSAQCLGLSHRHILFSDVLPNILHIVLPKFMLTIATAMIAEASLAFLGLGDPSTKSWGMMINYAFKNGGLINEMWWWLLPPGICITLVVSAVVLLSNSWEKGESAFITFND